MLLRIIIVIAASIFMSAYLPNWAGAQHRNGIPVLLYHHVSDDHSDMPDLTITVAEFGRQMNLLSSNGFQTITLTDFREYMRGGEANLPENPIIITFDDGYADNYKNAFPILKQNNLQAVIFMVGINFDRQNRLSKENIKEMLKVGFAVGAHSMTHPDLRTLSDKKLHDEVFRSKETAATASRSAVEFFAYPGGQYNLTVEENVEAAGFQGAFTVLTGLNYPGRDHLYLLRRIPIFRFTDFDRLLVLLKSNHPKTGLLDYSL
ncbi:MAG TPA: polysaccharide deacetylase family protein [Patescibacteria group bacterium]|nr:polysaccharide deacetylase family protein [Patescibacteria group bacterium]